MKRSKTVKLNTAWGDKTVIPLTILVASDTLGIKIYIFKDIKIDYA